MNEQIEFVRLVGNERRVSDDLKGVSHHWQGDKEKFLFISPHDDDVVLGSGLFINLMREENIPIYILIVTDGSMGYCSNEEKDTISSIRQKETLDCYKSLGVPEENIIWLKFPDCRLNFYRGRFASDTNEESSVAGYGGLENSFTYWLRKIRPTQCFLPTSSDLHPDHKIVHEEFLISLFHSAGAIWPELGEPVEKVPYVHEMGVYCDFPEPPKLRVKATREHLDKKLEAIKCYVSQKQIGSLVDIVSRSGPYEYFRAIDFKLYQPAAYYELFEKKYYMPFMS